VAHSLSAKKRIRQNEKRRLLNRVRKIAVREEIKTFELAISSGKLDDATKQLREVTSRLDKVASKNTIHKNAAARKRSRLTRRLNALKAKGTGTSAAKA